MNPYRSASIFTALLLTLLTASVALGQTAAERPVIEVQQAEAVARANVSEASAPDSAASANAASAVEPQATPEKPPAKAQATAKNPNPVKVRYDAPKDEKLVVYADLLKSGHLLEDMASELNSQIKLSKTLTLVGKQCGEANAFYQPSRQSIEICYEYARLLANVHIAEVLQHHLFALRRQSQEIRMRDNGRLAAKGAGCALQLRVEAD